MDFKIRGREELAVFLSSHDCAFKDQFAFFDLSAGVYNLEMLPKAAKHLLQRSKLNHANSALLRLFFLF
jgi:hypothetical protein